MNRSHLSCAQGLRPKEDKAQKEKKCVRIIYISEMVFVCPRANGWQLDKALIDWQTELTFPADCSVTRRQRAATAFSPNIFLIAAFNDKTVCCYGLHPALGLAHVRVIR
jgi:hypothetical protein